MIPLTTLKTKLSGLQVSLLNSPEKARYGISKQYYDTCSPGSWVAQLAEMYGCEYEIHAVPGSSNESIMLRLSGEIDNFSNDTLVIVMWSSKFRDRLFCLPQQSSVDNERWLFNHISIG